MYLPKQSSFCAGSTSAPQCACLQHPSSTAHSQATIRTIHQVSHTQSARLAHPSLTSRAAADMMFGGGGPEQDNDDDVDFDDEDWDEEEVQEIEQLTKEDIDLGREMAVHAMRNDWESKPVIKTAGTSWGDIALKDCIQLLDDPMFAGQNLSLYSFIVHPDKWYLDIALDKLDDQYGSPAVSDLDLFNKQLYYRMMLDLGQLTKKISLTVTSPGATRNLRLPNELDRFKQLPLRIQFKLPNDGACDEEKQKTGDVVLLCQTLDIQQDKASWKLADVKINRLPGKPKLNKDQTIAVYDIPPSRISHANLHLDF